jgi:ribosomal-protein-alanine N-acetyltransferase
MSYFVRPMQWQDIDQATEIDLEAFPTMLPPTNYKRELKNRMSHYIVAYDDQRVVGEASEQYIVGIAGFWIIAGEAHIVNIAVREPFRRRGIGELLLVSLIKLAIEKGTALITLEVRASNYTAQSLYLKYGFTLKGIRRGYYSDNGEDAVIMTADNVYSASFKERLNLLQEAYSRRWGIDIYQNV